MPMVCSVESILQNEKKKIPPLLKAHFLACMNVQVEQEKKRNTTASIS